MKTAIGTANKIADIIKLDYNINIGQGTKLRIADEIEAYASEIIYGAKPMVDEVIDDHLKDQAWELENYEPIEEDGWWDGMAGGVV